MWVAFALTIIIGAAWFAKMILQKKIFIQKTPLDLPILLFASSQVISTFFSLDTHISIWGYYSRFNGGLLSIFSYILLYYAFVSNYFQLEIDENNISKKHKKSTFTSVALFLSALALFPLGIIISIPQDPAHANPSMLFIAMIISLFLFIRSFPGGFLKRIILINITTGLIVALWGLPSHFGYDPTCLLFRGTFDVSCWTESFQPMVRIFSTLGQPAWLAAYVAVLLPLSIVLFLKNFTSQTTEKKYHPKNFILYILDFFLIVLFYLNLLFANTRAGFLGFWIAYVYLFSIIAGHGISKLRKRLLLIITFANSLLILFFIAKSYYALFWLISIVGYLFILTIISKIVRKPLLFVNLSLFIITLFVTTPFHDINASFSLPKFELGQSPAKTTKPLPDQKAQKEPGTDGGITESGNIRKIVWKGAIDIWRNHPLFGTGVETFAFAYYRYRPPEHNLTSEWDYLYNKAHNEYLNYLATTGAFGLGTYLLMIGWFLVIVGKAIASYLLRVKDQMSHVLDNTPYLLSLALLAGYLSILVSNFFGFSVVIINLYLFLIPAFIFILLGFLKPKSITHAHNAQQKSVPSLTSHFQWLILIVIFFSALFMLYSLFMFWQADKEYALGYNYDRVGQYQIAHESLLNAVTKREGEPVFKDELSINNAALASAFLQQNEATTGAFLAQNAIKLSDEITTKHPNNLLFWKGRVRIFYTLGQIDSRYLSQALIAVKKAHALGPTDAKISYNLGLMYGQTNDFGNAIATLQKTIELKPDYRDAYFALGLFYHELALDKNGKVVKPDMQKKAVDALQHILSHLSKDDKQTIDTLKTWGETPK